VKLYLHCPNTPSWRGAQLKHRVYFTFYHLWSVYLQNFHWLSQIRLIQPQGFISLPCLFLLI